MAIKKRTEIVNLKTVPDETVFITITIGNAQIGGNVLKYKGSNNVIAKGEITNFNLGFGGELKGRTLRVITNILDVNPQTNGVIVTYYFHACTPPVTFFHDIVNNDGDIFSFTVEFNFN
jgi:hypothetical protein